MQYIFNNDLNGQGQSMSGVATWTGCVAVVGAIWFVHYAFLTMPAEVLKDEISKATGEDVAVQVKFLNLEEFISRVTSKGILHVFDRTYQVNGMKVEPNSGIQDPSDMAYGPDTRDILDTEAPAPEGMVRKTILTPTEAEIARARFPDVVTSIVAREAAKSEVELMSRAGGKILDSISSFFGQSRTPSP